MRPDFGVKSLSSIDKTNCVYILVMVTKEGSTKIVNSWPPTDIQIWALLIRSQYRVSVTQVTIKADGAFVLDTVYIWTIHKLTFFKRIKIEHSIANVYQNKIWNLFDLGGGGYKLKKNQVNSWIITK